MNYFLFNRYQLQLVDAFSFFDATNTPRMFQFFKTVDAD